MGYSHLEWGYFSLNLRYLRAVARLSQHELAKRVSDYVTTGKVSQRAISDIEHGRRPGNDGIADAVAEVFQVSSKTLFEKPLIVESLEGVQAIVLMHEGRLVPNV